MSTRSSEGSWTTALAVGVLVLGAVLCAPGLVLVFAVAAALSVRLDPAQMWAFGATVSGVLWLGLSGVARSGWRGLKHHFVLSMLATWAVGISWWGFQFQWVGNLWRACTP